MKIKKLAEWVEAASVVADKIEEEYELPTTYAELRIIIREAFEAGMRYSGQSID